AWRASTYSRRLLTWFMRNSHTPGAGHEEQIRQSLQPLAISSSRFQLDEALRQFLFELIKSVVADIVIGEPQTLELLESTKAFHNGGTDKRPVNGQVLYPIDPLD